MLYLKYDSCSDGFAFARLTEELWAELDEHEVEHFVIDLRHNSGGNSQVIDPLLAKLGEEDLFRENLYAIIGERTYSSAILNAIALRDQFGAVLVGGASAGKPNHYGEIKTLRLPTSGLEVIYSTKYFRMTEGDPASLEPSVPVDLTAAEVLAGKDPYLNAVIELADVPTLNIGPADKKK